MEQKNKLYYVLLFVPFLFSSCAWVLNTRTQNIHLLCNNTLTLVKTDSSARPFRDRDQQQAYEVRRSKKPLLLEFRLKDASLVTYPLKSSLSPTYIFGNLLPYAFPVGYVVDLFFPNRFRYSPNNYFSYDTLKHKVVRKRFMLQEKNYLVFGLGWNMISAYHSSVFAPGGFTPLGLSLQADYFFKPQQSLRFEAGVAAMVVPRSPERVRAGYKRIRDNDSLVDAYSQSYWFAFSYRYQVNRFTLGAGLSFSPVKVTTRAYSITHRDTLPPGDTVSYLSSIVSPARYKVQHLLNAGFVFSLDYTFSKHVSAGINWHVFAADLNQRHKGMYASHFFNFYIAIKASKLTLHKEKTVYDYH